MAFKLPPESSNEPTNTNQAPATNEKKQIPWHQPIDKHDGLVRMRVRADYVAPADAEYGTDIYLITVPNKDTTIPVSSDKLQTRPNGDFILLLPEDEDITGLYTDENGNKSMTSINPHDVKLAMYDDDAYNPEPWREVNPNTTISITVKSDNVRVANYKPPQIYVDVPMATGDYTFYFQNSDDITIYYVDGGFKLSMPAGETVNTLSMKPGMSGDMTADELKHAIESAGIDIPEKAKNNQKDSYFVIDDDKPEAPNSPLDGLH